MSARFQNRDTALVAGASFLSRLALLGVVAAVGASFGGEIRDQIVVLIGVTTAAQVLLDPNSLCAYVVTCWSKNRESNASLLARGYFVVFLTGLIVLATPILVATANSMSTDIVLVGASVGAVSATEALARFGRAKYQATDQFGLFALVDVLLGCGRTAIAAAVLFWGTIASLAIANLVWAVIVILAVATYLLPRVWKITRSGLREFISGAWPFMGGSMFSAVYAQGPLVILSVIGTIHAAAEYTIAARSTQPLELVPASLAAVYLPRLTRAEDHLNEVARKQLRSAILIGVVFAIAVAVAAPLIPHIFGYGDSGTSAVIMILAISLPFKFVNYQLVAVAFAKGKAKQRFYIAGAVALVSVILVAAFASAGAKAVAWVAVSTEILLTVALALLARSDRVREVHAT